MEKLFLDDFMGLLRRRRSIRRFTPEPLSSDEVVELMRAALYAPSSKGRKACEYVVVDRPELLRGLADCKEAGGRLVEGAPLAVVVTGRMDLSDVWVEDASVAATLLLLAAESMGLGACWVQVRERGRADGTPAAAVVRSLLSLPPGVEPLAIVAVGHKAVSPAPHTDEELPWEKIHFNTWE